MSPFDPDLSPPEPTFTMEEAVSRLRQMATEAEGLDTKRCIDGEVMLYLPFWRALVPGHIYSETGIAEARISGCCEYHFDRMFEPGWIDALTGEKGLMPPEGFLDGL